MKKTRLLRKKTKRRRAKKRSKHTMRKQRTDRVHKHRRTRRGSRVGRTRPKKLVQRGGSGLAQALYNAAFVGSGPPFGVDPNSPAAQSCPGGGCDAAHYCNTQAGAGDSSKATPGMKIGTLCQNGAALLGQADPPPGSPFSAMQKYKETTSPP